MKRNWMVPITVAALAGLVSFGVTRCATHGCRCGAAASLDDVSVLTRKLDLNADQVRKVKELHAALRTTLDDCCARHCAARTRLGRALAGDTNDVEQAEAIITEMCRAYEQSERATLNRIRQVRAILNETQRTRFDSMISGCMCAQCPATGNARCAQCALGGADGIKP